MTPAAKRISRRIVIAGVVAILSLAVYFVTAWPGFDPCDTVVRRTVPSPSGKAALVVFERDCGATTPFNTQVSLLPAKKTFSPAAYPSFLSVRERQDLHVRWLDEASVEIVVPPDAQVYRQEPSVGGVAVTYK